MSRFTDTRGVLLRQLVRRNGRPIKRNDRSQWCPQETVPFEVGAEGCGVFVTVPVWDFSSYSDDEREHWDQIEGAFASDLGSIPPIVRGLPALSPDGPGVPAFLVHDLLYTTKGIGGLYTRKMADVILRDALEALGVGTFERNVIYQGVRFGGGAGWGR